MKIMQTVVNSSKISGSIRAVESKSDAHRALICSALCNGPTEVRVRASNNDIDATAECLLSMGAKIKRTDRAFFVEGRALGGGSLDCGESGSTARFLLPVAAALGKKTELLGSGRLPSRPMLPLTDELRKKGSSISADFLPMTVEGKAAAGRYVLPGNISSQFVSGLLMALPLIGEPSEILMSTPLESELYADMTVRTLERFGVKWKKLSATQTDGFCGGYALDGGSYSPVGVYNVEGDWSGASFFAVLAALGGELEIQGLDKDSLQPDKAIAEIVKAAGASVCFDGGALKVKKGKLKPISVDVSQFPDIFPILAVLACGAEGESILYNAERLRIKESDRIEATASMLTSLGARVETGRDYIRIFGTGSLDGGSVDGMGDHRIVMSAAVASVICEKEVEIIGCEAVNKSYRGFFDDFISVGGNVIDKTN